jgi:uncharacterized protein YsxB (DUF464 family)
MTKVTCTNDRGEFTIDIDGHAGYNPGMDIVCSAVSILGFILMNEIANMDGEIKRISPGDGNIHIVFKPYKEKREIAEAKIYTIMTGYELLAEQYPANVEIEY